MGCDPTLAQSQPCSTPGCIQQSRHRIKLFDDTHLGMEGVALTTSDDSMAAHRARFIQSVRLPLAALWKADLGLFTYGSRQLPRPTLCISTSGTSPGIDAQAWQ